ncbi:hypothetical protein FHT21_000881 [Pedobacter sp. SG908]|nr:hypothetical protein [Pedobacter sp. SG908]NMN35839.1 hypothetical protein [Pedobacter sp. SG918]
MTIWSFQVALDSLFEEDSAKVKINYYNFYRNSSFFVRFLIVELVLWYNLLVFSCLCI